MGASSSKSATLRQGRLKVPFATRGHHQLNAKDVLKGPAFYSQHMATSRVYGNH